MNFVARRRLPAPHPVRLPDRLRPVRASASTSACRRSATRTSGGSRRRRGSGAGCSASGISTMTEPLGAGNSREYDILGIKMFDSAELKVHMTGKAIVRTGAEDAGPGARDDLGPDRQPRARHPGRGHRRRGGRHRHRAVRHGHLRLAQHAGRRRGGRDGVAQDPGQGPQAGRAPARGVRGGRRVGARPVLRAQRAGPRGDHPGVRDGRLQQHARRHGAGPGEHRLLRPAEPDLAVRRATSSPSRSTRRPGSGTC